MVSLFIQYISISHLIVFSFAYFLLNDIYKKQTRVKVIFFLVLILSLLLGRGFSNLDSLFLLVCYFLLSLYSTEKKYSSSSLLFSIVPYLIESITTVVTRIPMSLLIRANSGTKQLFWMTVILVATFGLVVVLVRCFKKIIYPYIEKKKIISYVSIFLTLLIFIYDTYWLVANYVENLFLKYFIIIIYLFLIIFLFSILYFENKNNALKYEMKSKEAEYILMKKYEEETERQYNELRSFRHDYLNIISSLEYFFTNDDMEGAHEYFDKVIQPTRSMFQSNLLKLNKLNQIKSPELRSLFTTKLSFAQNKGIEIILDIPEEIAINQKFDFLKLTRIFAIILDNAIEELADLKEGKLIVLFLNEADHVVIVLKNSTRADLLPLHALSVKGYSSKGANRGLGLSNLEMLVESSENIFIDTEIANNTFSQKIILENGD
ncbi:GHKL domain-containing protein [Enterococcus sp. AZ103]|uniref:GHKL domain-containing protein n=1 Tax=Enterococcus sp. AZ103 TaxID=2774628 RepID=UPI003F682270